MSQLQLQIVPRLVYSGGNFIVHAGVRAPLDEALSGLTYGSFSLTSMVVPPRSGKTHSALYLMEQLAERGFSPHVIEGSEVREWIVRRGDRTCSGAGEVVIVDDCDLFLAVCREQGSGPFVQLVESFRREGAALILYFKENPEALGCDDHVMSRIRAARGVRFGNPESGDLPALISAMAAQRGIALTGRKRNFLARRLRHDIADLDRYFERAGRLADAAGSSFKLPLLSDAIGK